jgi:radical SAM superfamily enzyme YgiQ (UPF0313 family)
MESVKKCVQHNCRFKTVHQFNLPSETLKDYEELIDVINYIKKQNHKGVWQIPFIPNHPDPFTPLQWEKPYFDMDIYNLIYELRNKYLSDMKDTTGTKILIPTPLSGGSQFAEIITDWIPITPSVVKVVNKILKEKHHDFDYYLSVFKDNGIDLDYIFKKKNKDYIFPWDKLVEVSTSKDILYKANEVMHNKISKLVGE